MEELNWYREELDGRHQCPSEAEVVFPDGTRPRCRLEIDHTLGHAGDGFYWSDEESYKASRWHLSVELKYLNVLFMTMMVSGFAYALYKILTNPQSEIPIVWYFVTYGGLLGLIGILVYKTLTWKR